MRNPKTFGEDIEVDHEEEDMGVRVLESKYGNFIIRCKDPHGLWIIAAEKGALPNILKGQFTTTFDAEKAINRYIASRDQEGIINRKHREKLGLDLNG